ncbi:MAG: glycosyltransferase family 4 protein [Acidimicrobiia bacterium]
MDICVLGAQVPFVRGGAEIHMDNLVEACIAEGHRAELVRLPTVWDRERVFDAALAWRMVPLDCDLVICINFPSYFVQHPRKVVWLAHQHRSAYDGAGGPWSDFGLDDEGLELQRLLSEWDTRALSEATGLYCTSGVVADRLARYNGLVAEPVYHPAPLFDRLRPGPFGDVVFCPLRLEGNKRPGLVVDALPHIRSATRVALAGRGSLADELDATASRLGVRDRLDLLGFVSDDELVEHFAHALAVVYAPYDEDYGYVTLQAFRAGKPVITAADSGGVLEWVEDGVTGIVTDGSPEAIAEAVDRLAADHSLAEKLGEAGRERVADLAWGPVVERLTAP